MTQNPSHSTSVPRWIGTPFLPQSGDRTRRLAGDDAGEAVQSPHPSPAQSLRDVEDSEAGG